MYREWAAMESATAVPPAASSRARRLDFVTCNKVVRKADSERIAER